MNTQSSSLKFIADIRNEKRNAYWPFAELLMSFVVGSAGTILFILYFSSNKRSKNFTIIEYLLNHIPIYCLLSGIGGLLVTIVVYFRRRTIVSILALEFDNLNAILILTSKNYYSIRPKKLNITYDNLSVDLIEKRTNVEYLLEIEFYDVSVSSEALGRISNQDFLWERRGNEIYEIEKILRGLEKI